MCGLVGLFTNFANQTDVEKFELMLMLSSTRGKDSTGVLSVIRRGSFNQPKTVHFHTLKSPIHPVKYTEMNEWRTLSRFSDTKGWMGHTRAATVGAVNSANAHPFRSKNGNIIGSHNGTLMGDYPHKKEGQTDSEALINIIAEDGPAGLSKVNGAWAISYLDADNDTFNLIRNNERPLSYTTTTGGDFLYASEGWMLETIMKKYSMVGEIHNLTPYQKLTLDLSKERYVASLDVAPVEGLEAPKVTSYGNRGFFREGQEWDESGFWGNRRTYRAEDWVESEREIQRHGPLRDPVKALPAPRTSVSSSVSDLIEKRKEAAQKAASAVKEAGKIIGLDSERKSRQRNTSTVPAVSALSTGKITKPAFVRELHERQRLSLSGEIEIETFGGHWLRLEEFLDIVDNETCKWSDQKTAISDIRHWVNRIEFVSDTAWQESEELRTTLGVGADGKPANGMHILQ